MYSTNKDIMVAFRNKIATGFTSLPIVTQNDDAAGLSTTDGFIELSLRAVDSNFATINSPTMKSRTTGVLQVKIFTTQNTGIGLGLEYADAICHLLIGKYFDNITCYSPRIATEPVIPYTKSEFWMTVVQCPFKHDVFVTI
jgi:hypothetical protein